MFGDRPGTNWFYLFVRDPFAMGCLLLVSLVPTVAFGWALAVDRWIEECGIAGTAQLTWSQTHNDVHSHNDSFMVDYRFTPAASGQSYRPYWPYRLLQVRLPEDAFYRARNTKQVAVRYLPDHPVYNRPVECTTSAGVLALFVFSLTANVVLASGVLLAVHARQESRRRRREQQQIAAAA